MPTRYSALQDVEARPSIDESQTADVYEDGKNESKALDGARSSKTSIIKRLAMLSLFASYTVLIFGLGHASIKPDDLHAQPSAALPYIQGTVLTIWRDWKLTYLQKSTSSHFHDCTINQSHSTELWTIHQNFEVHHHQILIAHGTVLSIVSIKIIQDNLNK